MSKRRIRGWAILGCRGVPGTYGGFETFADQFARRSSELGIDLVVVCDRTVDKDVEYPYCRRVFIPLPANGALGILYDIVSILYCLVTGRHFILLGCSGASALPLARLRGLSAVTNTAGIEWGRSKWGRVASWFLRCSEKMAARWSSAVVADNEGIARHLYETYGCRSTVIAYGGDHLPYSEQKPATFTPEHDELLDIASDSFLAVARCQPDNNLEAILQAFADSGRSLVFVSNWSSSDYGRQMLETFSRFPNIRLQPAVYNVELLGYLRRHCIAYVHGHSAGGTNPSLVEAMWGGRNCLCFDNEFNRFTTHQEGLFWRDASDLRRLVAMDYKSPEATKRARRLREIAETRYAWSIIVKSYANLMESLS